MFTKKIIIIFSFLLKIAHSLLHCHVKSIIEPHSQGVTFSTDEDLLFLFLLFYLVNYSDETLLT